MVDCPGALAFGSVTESAASELAVDAVEILLPFDLHEQVVEVPGGAYVWRFEQARRGRGMLLFDDGWHKFSAAIGLFGPIREVRAWIGATEIVAELEIDAPTTILWEKVNGIRGVWDIRLAVDMYLRSDCYTNDERGEVTGRRGFARVNRCTGCGIQLPSFETHGDGVMRSYHALDDDWANSFRHSGRHWLRWLRSGKGPLLWAAADAMEILWVVPGAYESNARGGVGIDLRSVN